MMGLLLILMTVFFASCEEDEVVPMATIEVTTSMSYEFNDVKENISKLVLTNRNTGKVITKEFNVSQTLEIEEGVYTIAIEGEIEYQTKEMLASNTYQKSAIRGIKESVSVKGTQNTVMIELFLSAKSDGFVFSEIFFAGTKTPSGSQYGSDKYFELFNNSDQVLYADGLCISETAFLTTLKHDFTPDIMKDYVAVDCIYTIPGSGKDYPVQPGKSILIADVAKDHTQDNSNSLDLSSADFEWFDDDRFGIDVDIPSVPNMIKTYSSSASVWSLHNGGYKSFVLFRMDKPAEEFLSSNKYNYSYDFVYSGGTINMASSEYKVSNDLVLDVVGCTAPSKFEWLVVDPSLDISCTHSGDGDAERYGRSITRKVSHTTEDGRVVLLDSNNSAFDFIPTSMPTPGVIEAN